MKNYMFGDASFWQSTYTLSAMKLLVNNGMKAIVLRGGYAETEDSLLETLVGYCRILKIPFALYWYLYPSVDYKKQINKFISVINKYPDAKSAVLDFEEYQMPPLAVRRGLPPLNEGKLGYNYEAVMDSIASRGLGIRADLNLSGNYSSTVLSTFYKNSYDFLKYQLPSMKVWTYSAKWCIDGYFPQVSGWIEPSFYWNAAYVKYYTWYQDFIESLGGSWGSSENLISITSLPAIAAEVEKHWNEQPLPIGINGCVAWQFGSFFPFVELTKGQRNFDLNIAPASTFKEYFDLELEGGEPLPPEIIVGDELNMTGVSQIGVGANDHHNDCGLACCSMDVLAAEDIFVPVDQWYEMDGWGAPSLDIGTTAYQLSRALNLFGVRSVIGTSLTIENIREFIKQGRPITPLVDYGVLSNAGLTYYSGNFLHWFVVMGYNNDNVIVLDPYRPYDIGLKILIPNQIFLNSFRGSYLVLADSIEGGTMPVTYNGKVITASLNVRSTPPINGVLGAKVGALVLNDSVYIDKGTITTSNWGNVLASSNPTNPIGWVSMDYIRLETITPPPTGVDEKAIRLDEISKMETYLNQRKTQIG